MTIDKLAQLVAENASGDPARPRVADRVEVRRR